MSKTKMKWVDAAIAIAVVLFAVVAETAYWPGTAQARVVEAVDIHNPLVAQIAASVKQQISVEDAEKRGLVTTSSRQLAPEASATPKPRQVRQTTTKTQTSQIPDPAGDQSTSATLPMNQPVVSSIRAGDRDCFRVAPQGGSVTITLRPEPYGPQNAALFDRELRALDARGAMISEKVDWEEDEQTMTLSGPAATKARFVCVRGRFDAWVGDYELSMSPTTP
ncbi:MAG: hypothetical protein KTR21_11980 [Rhodobacteraceae bacterium]|nr:hypothetical protein [Paracoccaceae bacterium]